MRNSIRTLIPVVEAGDYDEFKRCTVDRLVLPVLGNSYRLYNDYYEQAWCLVEVCKPQSQVPQRQVTWNDYNNVHITDNCWCFGFRKREAQSNGFLSNFDRFYPGGCGSGHVYVECRENETWEDQVAGGYIVPEGNDVPHGSVRDDCIRRGVIYVVSRDTEALAKYIALTKEKSWNADEIKDYDPIRISRSSSKSDRYAVYARSLNRRLGKVTHQQHPQKKPGR